MAASFPLASLHDPQRPLPELLRIVQRRLEALATVPSLGRLRDGRQAWVLHDLERELDPTSEHSRWSLSQGWRASLTPPLFHHNRLLGFLCLDSTRAGAFDLRALQRWNPIWSCSSSGSATPAAASPALRAACSCCWRSRSYGIRIRPPTWSGCPGRNGW